jgi:hypothetical protein
MSVIVLPNPVEEHDTVEDICRYCNAVYMLDFNNEEILGWLTALYDGVAGMVKSSWGTLALKKHYLRVIDTLKKCCGGRPSPTAKVDELEESAQYCLDVAMHMGRAECLQSLANYLCSFYSCMRKKIELKGEL